MKPHRARRSFDTREDNAIMFAAGIPAHLHPVVRYSKAYGWMVYWTMENPK